MARTVMPPRYRFYGLAMVVLYLIIAATLLASLLIAIISYKYRCGCT
jgi:hypothetical protein